jgi:hypothetical protein
MLTYLKKGIISLLTYFIVFAGIVWTLVSILFFLLPVVTVYILCKLIDPKYKIIANEG